jgi:hypothetical protein
LNLGGSRPSHRPHQDTFVEGPFVAGALQGPRVGFLGAARRRLEGAQHVAGLPDPGLGIGRAALFGQAAGEIADFGQFLGHGERAAAEQGEQTEQWHAAHDLRSPIDCCHNARRSQRFKPKAGASRKIDR